MRKAPGMIILGHGLVHSVLATVLNLDDLDIWYGLFYYFNRSKLDPDPAVSE